MASQEDLEKFSQQIPCQSPVHPAKLSRDKLDREWRDIVHKKCSYDPAVGASSTCSLPLFDMCGSDTGSFEKFVTSDNFKNLLKLDDATRKEIEHQPSIDKCVENHKEHMREGEQEVLDDKIH